MGTINDLPEKIYLRDQATDRTCALSSFRKSENFNVEYVRSDIAESERNAFAIFCFDAGRWGGERDAIKLYELFNSRNSSGRAL